MYYSKSIFLFFAALSMSVLCQSSFAGEIFDEGEPERFCEQFKIVNLKSSIVYHQIIYHDNGKLCWKDPGVYSTSWGYNDSGVVYYSNGELCWKDPKVYNSSTSYNNSGIIYHSNGQLCWKDPHVYDTSFSYNGCGIVYYPNGQLCWKDPHVYNTSTSYNNCGIIYHSNGQLCWKDPDVYNTSTSYNNSGIIYHANGQLCWKDPMVYSDGGRCFDSGGNRIAFQGLNDFMFLELGDNNSVEICANGQFKLTISMEGNSCLVRSHDSVIALFQHLGGSLYFYTVCLKSSHEPVWIFDQHNNWRMVSENHHKGSKKECKRKH